MASSTRLAAVYVQSEPQTEEKKTNGSTGDGRMSRRRLLAVGGGTVAGGLLASAGSGLPGGVADAAEPVDRRLGDR